MVFRLRKILYIQEYPFFTGMKALRMGKNGRIMGKMTFIKEMKSYCARTMNFITLQKTHCMGKKTFITLQKTFITGIIPFLKGKFPFITCTK